MPDNYWENLPKKRMGVGVLFFNEKNELLAVKPTYKDGWTIPGGVINADESPREACLREVKEEIGLDIKDIKFLSVDYRRNTGSAKGESLQFLFYGGILKSNDIATIKLQENELSEYKFAEIKDITSLFNEVLVQRVKIALEMAAKENKPAYLEDGKLV